MQAALGALAALDRPTIAAIEGSAIGGGLAVALVLRPALRRRRRHLAAPPAKLGLVYGPIETSRLVALVGPARAKDLLFSGRRVAPAEALAIGLVDRVVPAAELHGAVEIYAAALAALSQRSIRGAKRIVDALAAGLPLDSPALRAEVEDAALGEDFREGRAAFAAKRAPRFAFRGADRSALASRLQSSFDSGIAEVGEPSTSSGGSTGGGAGRTWKASGGGIAADGPRRSSGPAFGRRLARATSIGSSSSGAGGRPSGWRAAAAGRAAGSAGNSGAGRSRSSRASPGRDGNGCSGRRRPPARARW